MTLKLRPIEEALERALRSVNPEARNVRELDAAVVARALLKHWGDEGPDVLARALELARETVASWTPKAPPVGQDPAGGPPCPPPPCEQPPSGAGTGPSSDDRAPVQGGPRTGSLFDGLEDP